jgi:hypothetical protein
MECGLPDHRDVKRPERTSSPCDDTKIADALSPASVVTAGKRAPMKKFLLVLAATLCTSPASAAGIDSHAYTCSALRALIDQQGFVFIGNPDFQDFVVSDRVGCSGDQRVQVRSVPTSDNPACTVNYCIYVGGPGSG